MVDVYAEIWSGIGRDLAPALREEMGWIGTMYHEIS